MCGAKKKSRVLRVLAGAAERARSIWAPAAERLAQIVAEDGPFTLFVATSSAVFHESSGPGDITGVACEAVRGFAA